MSQIKTPTSSLSVIELFFMRVWYRTLAWIRDLYSAYATASQQTSAACLPLAPNLPHEVIDMIIAYLIYDKSSLIACSLTCYAWYIVTVPHLHHTLITHGEFCYPNPIRWPKPLRGAGKLGLLPFVKKLHIGGFCLHDVGGFSSSDFGWFTLHYFRMLTNVQDLRIDSLDIPGFMPNIQRYIGHFAPTVRSLSLNKPNGSYRHLVFFIGLFQHLDDLELLDDSPYFQGPVDDPRLIPPFIPPLRGRLKVRCSWRVEILREMVDRFGGLRFRYMDLFCVAGMRLLLDACSTTLETLRVYPTDPRVRSSLQDFDLSRNTSLRTLELTASHVNGAIWLRPRDAIPILLVHTLSTVSSPLFSEVAVYYVDYNFYRVGYPVNGSPVFRQPKPEYSAREASWYHRQFETFRRLSHMRDFQLVVYANVWDVVGEYVVQELEDAIAREKERGGFDNVFKEPPIVYNPRGSRLDDLGGPPYNPWITRARQNS